MPALLSSLRATAEAGVLTFLLGLPPEVQRVMLRRRIVVDGQTLAPEVQLMLALQKAIREPQVEDLPVEDGRAALRRQAQLVSHRQPVGAVRDLEIDGAEGRLPARLYTPTSRLGAERVPTLLFLHGGGWVYGDLDSHDGACRHLAEHSGAQVLAVDYRLAPEHPFPAAADDVEAAYRWLVKNTDTVNADPERLAVGGDSAGGNLAALVALTAAREGLPLRFQLLVYPATDFTAKSASRLRFGEGFFLSEQFMDQCTDWYLQDPAQQQDARASLVLADVPDGTAPAFVVTAGFDPLRDEGEAYAERLASSGVEVEKLRVAGMIHGFFNMVSVGREAPSHNRMIAAKLREALS